MNFFLKESIEYAQQIDYWDDLNKVYPIISLLNRNKKEESFDNHDLDFIQNILRLAIFQANIKNNTLNKKERYNNTKTQALSPSKLEEINLEECYKRYTQLDKIKELAPQMFKYWVAHTDWGFPIMNYKEFTNTDNNGICIGSDNQFKKFANTKLNYICKKAPGFLARIHGKYVIGITSLVTDDDEVQKTQLKEELSTIDDQTSTIKVVILDGLTYKYKLSEMYDKLADDYSGCNIMSALVLRDFLYTIR